MLLLGEVLVLLFAPRIALDGQSAVVALKCWDRRYRPLALVTGREHRVAGQRPCDTEQGGTCCECREDGPDGLSLVRDGGAVHGVAQRPGALGRAALVGTLALGP